MTVQRRSYKYFFCFLLISFWLSRCASPAFCAESESENGSSANEGGLDSIWKDETATKNVASASSNSLPQPSEKAKDAESGSAICRLEEFLDSEFVRMSPWPGIGPFVAGSSSQPHLRTDASQNRLNLSVTAGKIKSLELELLGNSNGIRPFANLEMSVDFLLEGLGLKASKIHELNIDLETNIDQLTGKEPKRFKCVVDPLIIRIEPSEAGAKKKTFKIRVSSSTKSTAEPEENTAAKNAMEEAAPEKQSPASSLANAESKNNVNEQTKEPRSETPLFSVNPVHVSPEAKQDGQLVSANKDAALKQEFLNLVKHWQAIKKTAIRNGQTTELSQILSGPALAQQTAAVTWLAANHKYYDMTPESATVEHFTQVVAGKEYVVSCQLKEHRKFIDASNGHILKESEENNHVIYRVRKIGNNWLIEDSNIVKPPVEGRH